MKRFAVLAGFASLPVATVILVSTHLLNPLWLALPEAVICSLLLVNLKEDPWFEVLLPVFVIIIGITLIHPNSGALISALVLTLVSRHFGQTLSPESPEALITRLARNIRGPDNPLSEAAILYTTQVTRAWVWVLLSLALLQCLSVALGQGAASWLVGNSLAPVVIVAFLFLEPKYRKHRLPGESHASFRDIVEWLFQKGLNGAN